MKQEGGFDDRPRCIWCGSYGGYANRLMIHLNKDQDTFIAECDWCWSSDYYRKKAANGQGNQNMEADTQRAICCSAFHAVICVVAIADNNPR